MQRDLHDGLGPQLAAIGMQLDLARNLAAGSPEAAALLERLSSDTRTAIADIRRLVYDCITIVRMAMQVSMLPS